MNEAHAAAVREIENIIDAYHETPRAVPPCGLVPDTVILRAACLDDPRAALVMVRAYLDKRDRALCNFSSDQVGKWRAAIREVRQKFLKDAVENLDIPF